MAASRTGIREVEHGEYMDLGLSWIGREEVHNLEREVEASQNTAPIGGNDEGIRMMAA